MVKSIGSIGPERFTDDDLKDAARVEKVLMEKDTVSLRTLIRQAAHRIDNGTQRYSFAPGETKLRLANATATIGIALKVWEKRGYETDKPDIKYAYDALKRGVEFARTLTYKPFPPHKPYKKGDLKVVDGLIHDRRCVRRFKNTEVPDELLNKVLEAGTWAPCACCLQGSRFFVIKDPEKRKLIVQPWAAPIIIIAGYDERQYEVLRDSEVFLHHVLDIGAAIQNMLLMAYALGLGAGWASFAGEVNLMKRALGVPDYIHLVTYIGLGWSDDEPITVPRMELEGFVSRERWSGE